MNAIQRVIVLTNRHRKLIAAVAGVAVALFGERAGVGAEALTLAIITVATYIAGASIEDGLRNRN